MLLRLLPAILFLIATGGCATQSPPETADSRENSGLPRKLFTTGRDGYSSEYVSACLARIRLRLRELEVATADIPDGSLIVVSFGILPDGTLKSVAINKNNGGSELERLTREAISLAAPFPPFTEFLAQKHSEIVITKSIQYHADP
jgi:hypothetical protein